MTQSLIDLPVLDAPVAVVDIETTGLHPGADRVVEVSVVRIERGKQGEVVLNTLVNPQRRVAATEIHGITEADVADAPTFGDIAGDLARALAGAVLAAYNVYFDVRFLHDEFGRVGFREIPPHLCLMYLRPMLGLGKKCCLTDACRAHGIKHEEVHTAAFDAMAGARLWDLYCGAMEERGIRTLRELSELRAYKFVESLTSPPIDSAAASSLPSSHRFKPRGPVIDRVEAISQPVGLPGGRTAQLHDYWDALLAAVADLELTDWEIASLKEKRDKSGLMVEEIRAVHGRVFSAMLGEALSDERITNAEWQRLKRLHMCLAELGWAPGA